jgi:hypothetical protein
VGGSRLITRSKRESEGEEWVDRMAGGKRAKSKEHRREKDGKIVFLNSEKGEERIVYFFVQFLL